MYHLQELRKLKIGHAGLGRDPPPKAGTAVGHQLHGIGSINTKHLYHNFLVSFGSM